MLTPKAVLQNADDAVELFSRVQAGRQQVGVYCLLPVQRGGLLGGSWWQGTMLHATGMQQAMYMRNCARQDAVVQQILAVPCRQAHV